MRLATYNLWNPTKGLGERYEQLVTEMVRVNADVIGLQEVIPEQYEQLRKDLPYAHSVYTEYINEAEGLAIFSRDPIADSFSLARSETHGFSAALHAIIRTEDFRFSVTNLHLPWDSALEKEKQITIIDRFIKQQRENADFYLMMGDFNMTLESSVHRFLIGEQSLLGCEANPYWFDLASTYAAISHTENKPTLHFQENPRWGGKNSVEMPVIYDRILIMNSYGRQYREDLKYAGIFGTEISEETGYAPSDHYGVLADVDFYL